MWPFTSNRTARNTGIAGVAAAAIALAVAGLKPDEGLMLKPYFDVVGVETVCYGETQGIQRKTYTKAECEQLLTARVTSDYYKPMAACIPGFTSLPIPTQSATTRLAYNIGVGAACKSSAAKLLAKGHIREACNAFLLYNKGRIKGKLTEIRGLTLRRQREQAECLKGA